MNKRNGNDGTNRLFFALLPEKDIIEAIDFHAAQFSPLNGKKVKPENYHITLCFLGNVPTKTIDALCLDCESLPAISFGMEISRAGWWQKQQILWLGPESTPMAMTTLVHQLSSIANQRKIRSSNKGYVPHITIMRRVQEAPQLPVINTFTWQAYEYCLMQSFTHPDGVTYKKLCSWPLDE